VRIEVRHLTRYTYTEPVFLDRQIVRLKPVSNANQRLVDFDIEVEPQPTGQSALLDLDGNEAIALWFGDDRTDALTIVTRSTVDTLRTNPFDYLWQGAHTLPISYSPALDAALEPYRAGLIPDPVVKLAREVGTLVGDDAQAFLTALASRIRAQLLRQERPEGAALQPEETIATGGGSCRDLTVLYMAAARSQGFAMRFVSGYHAVPSGDDHELHAWAEAYIPGGGWRGFDPTTGLAVSDHHVVLATGARPEQAAPVTGAYRGRASSSLETSVEIKSS